MPATTTGATTPGQAMVLVPELGGYAAITYVDPTGRRWPMTDTSGEWYALAEGVSGLGAAPYTLTSDPHPRGGSRLRHVQPQARTIVWPILVKGSDHQAFTGNWRALATAFTRTLRRGPDGTFQPGTLEVARPDGGVRTIAVYYAEGWDGRGQVATGITWDSAVVTLLAEDPYWVDAVPMRVHRATATPVDYLVPYPSVSSSQVLGDTTVTNPGDVDVWPTWVITGPATAITFTRDDTGEAFALTMADTPHGPLLADEKVTVGTDPPRVQSHTGENLIAGLDWPGAVLWSLPPGETPVTFQLDGAETGSAVDLLFYPRYETA